MAKGGRFVDIKKSPRTINAWRLALKERRQRTIAMHRIVSYLVAKDFYDMLMKQIPSGSEYKSLRESLRISEVSVGLGAKAAYAVHVPVKSRKIRKLDTAKTIIEVRAKKRLNKPDPAVLLLEEEGPWTADTLPFWPSKKLATVVQRKVSKREVDELAKDQEKKRKKVRAELRKIRKQNRESEGGGKQGRVGRKGKAIPDVSMLALDLEFGTGGGKSKPVFRKSIRHAKQGIKRLPKRYKKIVQAMNDPNSKIYKNYPPKMKKISKGEATGFIGFQKRLGY